MSFSPNTNAFLLPKWRAALAKVKDAKNTGTGNVLARMLCVGDSTTMGVYSNGTSSGNLVPRSWPTMLSNYFNAAGQVNAHWNSFIGGGSFTNTFEANDSRLTVGSSFTQYSGGTLTTLGGQPWVSNTTTNAFSFTPTVQVDTFKIYYITFGTGMGTIQIGAGSTTNITNTSGNGLNSATIVGTLGANTLNVKWASGNNGIYIIGIEAWDSSKSWVSVMNAGWSGSKATDWGAAGGSAGQPYSPYAAMSIIAPDLTNISLGINDWVAAESAATYITNMQLLITAAKLTGDCMLTTCIPSNTASASLANQQALITAAYSLAQSNGLLLVDNWARWVSYAVSQPLGLYGDTALHPSGPGYADYALPIFQAINV